MANDQSAYKVTVNELVFTFSKTMIDTADIIRVAPGAFHLISNHRSVNARIVEEDQTGKKLRVEVEGETFDITIKDDLDQQLETMGYSAASGKHIREIKAPMPGLVLNIAVTDGQQVNEGDRILVLEAMKMENSITIHANARIKRVAVSAGQAVEKGQVLVELE